MVLTPGGQTLELPVGATPVDVAYFLGDNVASNAYMAIVNEKAVPFNYKLHEYDRVQIVSNPNYPHPKDNWEEYATTTKAHLGLKRSLQAKK